jgi:hypothetical protein
MGRRNRGGRSRHRSGQRDDRGNRREASQGGEKSSQGSERENYNRHREQNVPRARNMPSMMRRMFLGATSDITVVIRTDNGDPWLDELLASLRNQDVSCDVETIAVDAGSTDRTPLILRARGIRTLHARPGTDYLQQVLDVAEGDVVVFLSQDTLPLKREWLKHLAVPLLDDKRMGIAYGRVIADASVPPYPRGLISARSYVSGKETLGYTRGDAPGANYFPSTNVAGRKKALMQLGSFAAASQSLQRLYTNDWSKFYLPHAVAVIKGESTSRALFEALSQRPEGDTGAMGRMVADEFQGMLHDLYELSSHGDLPNGQRGEAYLSAMALHSDRALRLVKERYPILKKLSRK